MIYDKDEQIEILEEKNQELTKRIQELEEELFDVREQAEADAEWCELYR